MLSINASARSNRSLLRSAYTSSARHRSMRYSVHTPGPPLNEFVSNLWSLSDAPRHERERILPSGTIELVINLQEDEFRIYGSLATDRACRRFRGAIVSGCYGSPFEIDTREHASVVGVHFRPGGAARLLGLRPGEITDAHVGLEDVWGRRATELRERLCGEPDQRERFRILEQALTARLLRVPPGRTAVNAALSALDQPGVEVGEVARSLGLSRRRFIEIFTEDVGMTPKRYSRVRRFQRALALATSARTPTWAQLALECGYFDQAHLCREWAELAGVSPGELLVLRTTPAKENHLALPGGSNLSNTPLRSARTLSTNGTHDPSRNA
jgi:AraC-like DNA-binding protein